MIDQTVNSQTTYILIEWFRSVDGINFVTRSKNSTLINVTYSVASLTDVHAFKRFNRPEYTPSPTRPIQTMVSEYKMAYTLEYYYYYYYY